MAALKVTDLIERPALDKFEEFGPGDGVVVTLTIAEGERERAQEFKGNVIRGAFTRAKQPPIGATFIVRRVSAGVGVERTIPFYSPFVQSVKVVRRSKVKRARIYYLRELSGKKARLKEKAR